ncbi:hypothetical protein AA313_de0207632 [Arthrobotrys entomopaga]|nr:hypothetical protein AA313_de0207632 [Arthrobotrys entomopaga]
MMSFFFFFFVCPGFYDVTLMSSHVVRVRLGDQRPDYCRALRPTQKMLEKKLKTRQKCYGNGLAHVAGGMSRVAGTLHAILSGLAMLACICLSLNDLGEILVRLRRVDGVPNINIHGVN